MAPYLIISSTIRFTALKRPRLDTSYTPNTYYKFNSRGCDNIAYKYLYKYLKYSKDHTILSKAYA